MKEDIVRMYRIIEYIGPRSWVEDTVARSVQGTKRIDGHCQIRGATLGNFADILDKEDTNG